MLIFTSGTSGEPKAVRCTHSKIAVPGQMLAGRFGLTAADTVYVSMPMFHSNAIMAGWAVGLAAGAAIALRRSFSASGFLPDVRAFGATYANYVGKPLSYVLATPARADDADNPLRIAYGNEGAPGDLARFAGRFGCQVIDGFGSTEGGVAVSRTPDTPAGALGKLADGVAVLDPETGRRCPPARFGPGGELLNPAEAVGEFVNTLGAGLFAGYYHDAEADASRMRDGMYWSGDLGYADSRGFCWFAGRAGEWLRVDGENLGTAPVERALRRHPAISEAAVYGVPDPVAGDQIMACIVLRSGASLTPAELGAFLTGQGDLGPRQHPRFVRVATQIPRTATFKTLTRVLAADRWNTSDPVWWRPDRRGRSPAYVPLDAQHAAALDAGITAGPVTGVLTAEARQLIDGQYADRPHLRPVLDAVLAALPGLGPVTVQARTTLVSLVTPRRTFAVVQATTKNRVDLGLRLDTVLPGGRLLAARDVGAATVRIGLSAPGDLDEEALRWLRRAYAENTAPAPPRRPARRQAPKVGQVTVVIEGFDLPGLTCAPVPGGPGQHNVHVALPGPGQERRGPAGTGQDRAALVLPGSPLLAFEPVPGDAPAARWEVNVTVRRDEDGFDFSGPFVRGDRSDRHLGLAWGDVPGDGTLRVFRGAKLRLADVEPQLIEEAMRPGQRLLARVRLTDARGNPVCARLRPPAITWSAGPG